MRAFLFFAAILAAGLAFSVSVAAAWTGPTAAPTGNNVSAPLNVSATAQVKNGDIGINDLAVYGNTLLDWSVNGGGSITYLNFSNVASPLTKSTGYGIRDNNGTLEFKNSGGAWSSIQATVQSLVSSTSQWTGGGRGSGFNYNTWSSATAEAGSIRWVDGGSNTNGPISGGNSTGQLLQLDPLWNSQPDGYKVQISVPYDGNIYWREQYGGSWGGWGEFIVANSSGNATIPNQLTASSYCISGSSCITTWPSSATLPYPVTASQTWHWSGQSGQPSWLWGSNDGNNMYVWNPSNFSVANSAQLGGIAASSYVTTGSSPTFGTVTAAAYYYNSDERLKTDIAPITSGMALSDVLALQPVTFDWKDVSMGAGQQIGFIAQQVQTIVPQIVETNASTTMEAVDYARVTPLLVGSVQQLDQQIQSQQSQIDAQQQEIDQLTAEINALKQ